MDYTMPFVSVIIPVLNGEQTIRECLVSLLRMDFPPERREIVVVDNGSTDRTAEIVKGFPVRYVREERRGRSHARNKGIEVSRGEILAFTDADCVVTRDWLKELVRSFDEAIVGGVAGEVVAYLPKTVPERYAARIGHLSPKRYLQNPIFPFAMTGNVAFRREVFSEIGLFDPSLPTGEGGDFFRRFFNGTGLKLQYASRAVVFHRHRTTAWELFKQLWGYGRGHALLCIKYREELQWGWQQTGVAYRDLANSAWTLAKAGLRYGLQRSPKENLVFCYLEFLHKLAYRLGFMRQALSRGYLYF